jgi:hypothetical protein
MIRKRSVPTPEKKIVVVGGRCVMIGTRKVAPNIAAICWRPVPTVIGQLRRSCGATTPPDLFSVHEKSDIR